MCNLPTESNAYHIRFLPLALSEKITFVAAKVPEMTLVGTGWFACSFLNQLPRLGRWICCSYWGSLVDTHSWSWKVEAEPFLNHKDWEWEEFYYQKRQYMLGIVWSGGFDPLRWFLPVWFPTKHLSCWHGPAAILLLDIEGHAERILPAQTWSGRWGRQALCPNSPPIIELRNHFQPSMLNINFWPLIENW